MRASAGPASAGPGRPGANRPGRAPFAAAVLIAVAAGGLTIEADNPSANAQFSPVAVAEIAAARVASGELRSPPARASRTSIQRAPAESPPGRCRARRTRSAPGSSPRSRAGWSRSRSSTARASSAGESEDRRYAAASVVKAMLLAAEMRRLKQAGEEIDSATDSLLTAMITMSDNAAADAIYARVGDAGPVRRRRARRDDPLHRRRSLGQRPDHRGRHGAVLRRPRSQCSRAATASTRRACSARSIESQRWGIPAAAGDRWAVRFKGGWLPDHALVHQAAELRERDGSRSALDRRAHRRQPSFDYGDRDRARGRRAAAQPGRAPLASRSIGIEVRRACGS